MADERFSRLHAARCSGRRTGRQLQRNRWCFSRLHAARCSGRRLAELTNGGKIEFQSPSCGAVFGTMDGRGTNTSKNTFQSPSCGAVFGTRLEQPSVVPAFRVSVAFMRRGVRDRRARRSRHRLNPTRFSRLHAARCSGPVPCLAQLSSTQRFSRLHAARCSGRPCLIDCLVSMTNVSVAFMRRGVRDRRTHDLSLRVFR